MTINKFLNFTLYVPLYFFYENYFKILNHQFPLNLKIDNNLNFYFNFNYQIMKFPQKFHLILQINEYIQKLYKLMDIYQ